MLLGGLFTVLLGWACGQFSRAPKAWLVREIEASRVGGAKECPEDGEAHLRVFEGVGFGYRSWYAQTDTAVDRKRVTSESRCVLTELGWPQLALGTRSADIAERLAKPDQHSLAEQGSRDRTHAVASGLQLSFGWSGFICDSILFGLPILTAWIGFRRSSQPFAFFGASIAALALWLCFLTAWGACVLNLPHKSLYFDDATEFAKAVHPPRLPEAGIVPQMFDGRETTAPGYRYWSYVFFQADPTGTYAQAETLREESLSIGWPFPAFVTQTPPSSQDPRYIFRVFQIPVFWPGLIADWACYVVVLVVVLRGPRTLLRAYRWRRGRCIFCGYPQGSSSVCAECGHSLRQHT